MDWIQGAHVTVQKRGLAKKYWNSGYHKRRRASAQADNFSAGADKVPACKYDSAR